MWTTTATGLAVAFGCLTFVTGTVDDAFAQAALPPVTVDAPRPSAPRTAAATRRTSTTRSSPRPSASVNPVPPTPIAYRVPSVSQVNAPPAPFAGGQVASGTQVGLLGNRNVFDTPFSVAGYTKDLVQSIQAKGVSDVLERDPAVTVGALGTSYYDVLAVRGFAYSTYDFALNGLFGLAPATTFPVELFDRVEVLRGPSQLLYGYPPTGTLGGVINLVPKHATDVPIAHITGTYWSNNMWGTAVDVGQRYGAAKEWGVRANALYRNGSGSVDRFSEEAGAVSLGLDYRGERVRASLDLYHNEFDQTGSRSPFNILPGVAVPTGVRNANNYAQPYEFMKAKYDYGVARAEADLTDSVTVFGAVGGSRQTQTFIQPLANTIFDNLGNMSQFEAGGPFRIEGTSAEVGMRSEFFTGPVKHKVVVSAQEVWLDRLAGITFGLTFNNIYAPFPSPNPGVSVDAAGPALPVTRYDNGSVGVADTLSVWEDRVALTVGVRHQRMDQDGFGLNTGILTNTQSDSKTSPAVALAVKPVDNVTVYANYIEALTQITPAPLGTTNANQTFAPVVTQQKEVGVKVNWWGNLGTTFAAFDITSPSVFTDPATNTYGPLGVQRNRGLEFTVFGQPLVGLKVLAGVSLLDGRLERALDPTSNGRKAPGVPDFQGSAGVDVDIPWIPGLTISPVAVYVGDSFADPQNTQRVPGYVRADLGASYTFANPWLRGRPVVVRGRVVNLFDANYLTNLPGGGSGGGLSLGTPRTYMVSTTVNF